MKKNANVVLLQPCSAAQILKHNLAQIEQQIKTTV